MDNVQINLDTLTSRGQSYVQFWRKAQPDYKAALDQLRIDIPESTDPINMQKHGAECLSLIGKLTSIAINIEEFKTLAELEAMIKVQDKYPDAKQSEIKSRSKNAMLDIITDGFGIATVIDTLDERVKWTKAMIKMIESDYRNH